MRRPTSGKKKGATMDLTMKTITRAQWEALSPDSRGVIEDSLWTGWPVGTRTMLEYNPEHGTCLVPVLVEGMEPPPPPPTMWRCEMYVARGDGWWECEHFITVECPVKSNLAETATAQYRAVLEARGDDDVAAVGLYGAVPCGYDGDDIPPPEADA